MNRMTPLEWMTLAQIAATLGMKLAEQVLAIRERLAAGEAVSMEEMLGVLRQIDYNARVPNSLVNNPITPPSQ